MQLKVELTAACGRARDDFLDEHPNRGNRLVAGPVVRVQGRREILDAAFVDFHGVGVPLDRFRVLIGQHRQRSQPSLELTQFFADRAEVPDSAISDGVDEPRDPPLQFGPLLLDVTALEPCVLLELLKRRVILVQEGLNQLGLEQALPEATEDAVLDIACSHGALVRAGALLPGVRASITVFVDDDDRATANPTLDQAAEQAFGPLLIDGCRSRDRGDTLLHPLPEGLGHDGQFGYIGLDPFFLGLSARPARTGVGVAYEGMPVEHLTTNIEGVGQKPDTAPAMSLNRGRVPLSAARGGDAFGVEALCDCYAGASRCELLEDALNHCGLVRDDTPMPPYEFAVVADYAHDLVAVGDTSCGTAFAGPADLAAQRLRGEVLQEEGVHRTLEADMKLADLSLGEGDGPYLPGRQALVEAGDVFLVPAEAVEPLGEDDVQAARTRQIDHGLDAGSLHAGARERVIGEDLDHAPAERIGAGAAQGDLVLDRALRLQLARVARIDRDAGGGGVGNGGHG